ncbi:MAG: hypothetical protein ACREGA_00775 [Candidatus Saccharimonadales bacterium]
MKNNERELTDVEKRQIDRSTQRFKVLASRPDFQKDVAQFRQKWNINTAALKKLEGYQAWWQQHYADADSWRREEWPKYRQELEELEKASLKQHEDRLRAINQENPINTYQGELIKLIERYRLPPKWKQTVQAYIFTNEPEYRGSIGISIRMQTRDDGKEKDEVLVALDAYTTRKDLLEAWPTIKFHLDSLRSKTSKKYQPVDDEVFARNATAYRMHSEGSTYKKIAEFLTNSDDYEGAYAYSDIPTMTRNYKRQSGIK